MTDEKNTDDSDVCPDCGDRHGPEETEAAPDQAPGVSFHALRLPMHPDALRERFNELVKHYQDDALKAASQAFTGAVHEFAITHGYGPATTMGFVMALVMRAIELDMDAVDSEAPGTNAGTMMATAMVMHHLLREWETTLAGKLVDLDKGAEELLKDIQPGQYPTKGFDA